MLRPTEIFLFHLTDILTVVLFIEVLILVGTVRAGIRRFELTRSFVVGVTYMREHYPCTISASTKCGLTASILSLLHISMA